MTALSDFTDLCGTLSGTDTTTLAALTTLVTAYVTDQTAEDQTAIDNLNGAVTAITGLSADLTSTYTSVLALVNALSSYSAMATEEVAAPVDLSDCDAFIDTTTAIVNSHITMSTLRAEEAHPFCKENKTSGVATTGKKS